MKSNSLIVQICATLVGISFVIAFFFWLSYGRKSPEKIESSVKPVLSQEQKTKILQDLSVSPVPISDQKKAEILKALQAPAPTQTSGANESIGGTGTLTAEQKAQILRDLQK